MRFSAKMGAPLLAIALALTACGGTTGGDDEGRAATARPALRDVAHRLLRRPDRRRGQPRHQHPQRRRARHQPVQRGERRLPGRPSRSTTRRATRTRPPAWPRRPSATTPSSASSARPSRVSPRPPARSSPRPACRPSPRRPPTRPWPRTAGTPSTASSATTPPRVPRPRLHQRRAARAKKVFVVDDASEYGAGLADIVNERPRRRVVGDGHDPDRSDRLLRDRHQGPRLRAPTRSSSAATTPRPACSSSSCVAVASTAPSSSPTA